MMPAESPGPGEELPGLREQALSDDPATRASVGAQLSELMERDFENVFERTKEWVVDPDPRLREVACRALTVSGAEADLVRTRRLLGRAEERLGDPSPEVAGVVSQEVVPHLLSLHPRLVPEWIAQWTKSTDEPVRANLAWVLASLAARFPAPAVDGLGALAVDPRSRVRSAVRSAIRQVAVHQPAMADYLRARFPQQF